MNDHRCAVLSFAALAMLVPAVLAAENQETTKGRIQEVRPSAHQVTITTDGGKELTLRVDDRSRLEQQGHKVALDQFKKGMQVRVTYATGAGEKRVVSLTPVVSGKEVEKNIGKALQSIKSYTFQQKDEYRKKLQGVMEQADERIAELQRKADRAGAEAKQQYAEQIQHLRRLRDKAHTQLERVNSATPQAWDDLKSGVGSALDDLRKAFEKAADKFR